MSGQKRSFSIAATENMEGRIQTPNEMIKLTDQSIDSKNYIKRYLTHTSTDGVKYSSLLENRVTSEECDSRAELQDFNSLMEHKQ